ncbi:nicotinate (nicotinamide) nucleotide adenylyltransferase [Coraliomargarita sp. SDUM461004]|uniref:Probable nicotinate-nucleotide adenylyltransferase n=1 Tax=Thalassobacterium sedimentorum TaxID=3041258 RepID=A0ABU1AG91_9BACT|nr:nicotinate (nicotinamide) nucleotide adenylyltransferase [Coraliomargarita sp. SDUM461004]MDQ8193850.1 nicotinate (nicotinamide) nucleotide adenylyltransferase [Coraliomargarita sp. SDUM461004]
MNPTELAMHPASVALYGGSFDPVHRAHLQVARSALANLDLQQVIFIPAAQSPLKTTATVASDADRVSMLRLATADEARFFVDTCELQRGGTSYTIDTVMNFRAQWPNCQLHWIIGADQFECLHRWHRIEDIVSMLHFIVLQRPGHSIAESKVPGLKYTEVQAPLMTHSSSEIRFLLKQGRATEDLLPPAVEAFISSHGLYTQ